MLIDCVRGLGGERLTAFRRRGGAGWDRRRVVRLCRESRSEARRERSFGARPQLQQVVALPLPAARAHTEGGQKQKLRYRQGGRGEYLMMVLDCLVEEALGEHRRAGGRRRRGRRAADARMESTTTTGVAWKTKKEDGLGERAGRTDRWMDGRTRPITNK